MAIYHDPAYLNKVTNAEFIGPKRAGDLAPFSGIYRCDVCGYEAVATKGNTLPPQGGVHTHLNYRTPIVWRLIVASVQV